MSQMRTAGTRFRQRGFTIVELMIVVVIIAVLGAIAFPSYTQYVTKSRRQAVQNVMVTLAQAQEQFFMDNKGYAANLSTLGYGANSIGVDNDGQIVEAGDSGRAYVLDLTNAAATTYTVRAVPQLVQASRDTDCKTLTLTHTGDRDQTGDGDNCW